MPKSALPLNYKLGPDNKTWLMRLKKKVQFWFAAGPRVKKGFWKWREYPITLFAIKGKGEYRFEDTDGNEIDAGNDDDLIGLDLLGLYLSRIQCWTRWHISLQWPLFFSISFYYKQKDVSIYPKYPGKELNIFKLFVFQIGYKRDSDLVYWPTLFLGGRWE